MVVGMNLMLGQDRTRDQGAGDEIGCNVGQDDVSAVRVTNTLCLFLNLLGVDVRFVYDFISVRAF